MVKKILKKIRYYNIFGIVFCFIRSVFRIFFYKDRIPHKIANSFLKDIIFLFCSTKGYSSDLLSKCCSLINPIKYQNFANYSEIFPSNLNLENIIKEINIKGYCLIPSVISEKICEEIVEYALNSEFTPRAFESKKFFKQKFIPTSLKSGKYDKKDLPFIFENSSIQKIIFDNFFLTLSSKYFSSLPFLDNNINLFWSLPFNTSSDEFAEDYHFDMDTLKWLKFFINFEDINLKNGPHAIIEGSHLSGNVKNNILFKGYSRISDEDVFNNFPKESEKIFLAPRGSILIEDTRAIHKGIKPIEGRRLLLAFQYSNLIIDYNKAEFLISNNYNINDNIKEQIKRHPEVFKKFLNIN